MSLSDKLRNVALLKLLLDEKTKSPKGAIEVENRDGVIEKENGDWIIFEAKSSFNKERKKLWETDLSGALAQIDARIPDKRKCKSLIILNIKKIKNKNEDIINLEDEKEKEISNRILEKLRSYKKYKDKLETKNKNIEGKRFLLSIIAKEEKDLQKKLGSYIKKKIDIEDNIAWQIAQVIEQMVEEYSDKNKNEKLQNVKWIKKDNITNWFESKKNDYNRPKNSKPKILEHMNEEEYQEVLFNINSKLWLEHASSIYLDSFLSIEDIKKQKLTNDIKNMIIVNKIWREYNEKST